MNNDKQILLIVEKTNTGFSAFSEEYPIFTTGKTIPDLLNNTYEAVNFYFEELNKVINKGQIQFTIDFQQFFEHYRFINVDFLAEKIGISSNLLNKFIQGNKKPSSKQIDEILNGIHQIGQELSDLQLLSIN